MDAKPARLHPLIAVAAISVTLAALAAVAVLTGVMPGSHAATAPAQVAATEPPPPPATATATVPTPPVAQAATSTAEPAAAAKPEGRVVHHTTKHTVAKHRTEPQLAATEPAPEPAPAAAPPEPAAPPPCPDCGTVVSVHEVVQQGQGTGLGVVAGGVLGGVLGHQVGRGTGNDLATIAGALGGAFAGNQIEKSQRKSVHYDVTVRMQDGSTRTVTTKERPIWREGDHVRVVNGELLAG